MLPSNQVPIQLKVPTIVVLRRLLDRTTLLLRAKGFDRSPRIWNPWIRAVRDELGAIYGARNSVQLDHFQPIPNDLTDDQFRATLSDRIEHLRRLSRTSRSRWRRRRLRYSGSGSSSATAALRCGVNSRTSSLSGSGFLGTSSIEKPLQVLRHPNDSK